MSFPDGPKQPALAQLAQWIWRPLPFMRECFRRYGEVAHLRMTGFGDVLLVSSPELIKEIFTAAPEVLHAGRANEILRPVVGDHSILLLDTQEHLRHRRLLLPPFHGERMQSYATLMRDLTEATVDSWPVGRPFKLHPHMQAITLDVIMRTVFGLDEGAQARHLAQQLMALLAFNSPALVFAPSAFKRDLPLSPYRQFLKLKVAVDGPLFEILAERRRQPAEGRTDILTLLLSARDEQGQGMTDVELRDELLTLLLAGHETSATALAWVMERLLVETQARERVEAELAEVVGAGRLEPAHLPRLEYLDAVIKETMRLRPILPAAARLVMGDFTLGGRPVPKGTLLLSSVYLTHLNPRIYPEPERFRPERFLGVKADPYAWLPFGGGVRRCIGMAFALQEIKIVLATLLSRVRLRLTHPGGEKAVRRQVILSPGHGTEVILTERRVPATMRAAS